ncbi:MAG: asparagine synthase (glutamine-hydrolyzing) [Flaviramulus sp.]|nr:asparagine synthase (glutamine-hydrolyzing) [Flaviramulus sp.]NNC50246.1 asparagine synthase (glutamine-hydrolyzing) [Flaviramulus sp.]
MCGFTAFFSFTNIDNVIVERLLRCNNEMFYRGPDEQDLWNDDKVALAHVRLSIIGLNNGHQPLFNESKSLVLICNGEIYNYKSLKRDLEFKGHVFSSLSDCEVILHMYEEYGEELNSMLDGMFAYCLYDIKNQKLVVGRDSAGMKPIYYSVLQDGLVFSSELKVIKTYFQSENTLNFENLRQVQKYTYSISARDTYIESIKKIPSGSFATINRNTGLNIEKFHKRNFNSTFDGDYQDACKEVKRLLFSAVEKRLMSEVPVGVLLSAGVDSSAIVGITRQFRENVSVISAGYKGNFRVDERREAKRFSDDMGLLWNDIELDSNEFNNSLYDIFNHLDEPNGDVAMFAQWAIYQKASKMGFKVLLSGNGSDELFYGYKQHNYYAEGMNWIENNYLNDITIGKKAIFKEKLGQMLKVFDNSKNRYLKKSKRNSQFPVYAELTKLAFNQELPLERTDWERIEVEYYIDKIYFFLHYAWLTNNCYFLADKLAMAHSIEVRSPFADKELIRFVDTLPVEFKFPDCQPKKLLKDSLKTILPDYVLNRYKTGFEPPYSFVKRITDDYNPLYFKEKPTTFAQLVTDYFASSLSIQ